MVPLPAVAGDEVRDRACRLFTFLQEYTQLRARTVLATDAYDEVVWLADVPRLPGCFCAALEPAGDAEVWIELRRPRLDSPPPLPAELEPWVDPEAVADSSREVPALRERIPRTPEPGFDHTPPSPEEPPPLPSAEEGEGGDPPMVALRDRPDVSSAWHAYVRELWQPWAEQDRVLQRAQRIYTDLFRIYQSQQRLGEAYEVVLGIGHLAWRIHSDRDVARHVLVAQANVRFDADRGIISVAAAADGARPSLEHDMLAPDERPPREVLDEIGDDLATVGDDVLGDPLVVSAVRRWAHAVSARASFDESLRPGRVTGDPCVTLAPALILRRRSDRSIVQALTAVADQLRAGAPIPEGVRRLVDLSDPLPSPVTTAAEAAPPGDPEVLFPLPSNQAQLDVVRRLEERPGVVVQGPPGTGKSHTIANLVTHLLAHGQRVLVTSHTARALEVLRDRVPAEVRELAVVVLGNDARGRDELHASVRGISERYATWNAPRSRQRVASCREALSAARLVEAALLERLRLLRERDSVRHPPAFGGYGGTVEEIARMLRSRAGELGWLADPAGEASEAPVTDEEAVELLSLLRSIDAEAEAGLRAVDVESRDLPSPDRLEALVVEERAAAVANEDLQPARDLAAWPVLAAAPVEAVGGLTGAVAALRQQRHGLVRRHEAWVATAAEQVAAGLAGRWRALEQATVAALGAVRQFLAAGGDCQVVGVEGIDLTRVRADATMLHEHLLGGGRLGVGPLRAEPVRRARYLVDRVRVDGAPCRDPATLARLATWAYVREQLDRLDAEWASTRTPGSGSVRLRVAEYEDVVSALQAALRLDQARETAARAAALVPGLAPPDWEDDAALGELLQAAEASRRHRRLRAAQRAFDDAEAPLRRASGTPVERALLAALEGRDVRGYEAAYRDLERLEAGKAGLRRREELMDRLRGGAPQLAGHLAAGALEPVWDHRLPALSQVWNWARADAWLAAQADPTLVGRLERDLDDARQRIERATRQLAAELAWAHCLSRLSESERVHLETWEEAVRKIGKGTGKHAARWRQRAREAMQGCRSAIPAWIMPIFKVAEAVDMAPEAFDVAIVDEASQSGPEALFLQYLARKVIVVGDDQQISPDNVGVDRDKVQFLNAQYLYDIPLAMHYDADTSYFTHAAIRYGDRLVLQEHFRCMPEIIQFSNSLCYQDRPLVPLRQFGSARLSPAVRVQRVEGGVYDDAQVNEPEARAVVAQVIACLADPTYSGRTFGVVSLVGSEQARLIGRMLADRVEPAEIERRRLLCGDAYAFQGDERDVMFLSLVQAPREGRRLYAATASRDRRRFNVAASRARDQLWLFHTAALDDLHPEGVAHRLLRYCMQPELEPAPAAGLAVETWRRRAAERSGEDESPYPFDSWLEVDVFLRLVDGGFRVVPQYEIADYRVDLLVEGFRGRLAVECDSDRWHGAEAFERDLVRQRMLERCGLPFSRVRGASFYRDPDSALQPLWADLRQHEILPVEGLHPPAGTTTFPSG